jgi:uncharacterized protein YlzI (FlbEa/FlbD family)
MPITRCGPARGELRSALQTNLQILSEAAECASLMPLIKLNRINKGGEIVINSEHILYIEVESRTTTVHMAHNLLFSVEESIASITEKIEAMETARIKDGIQQSGLTGLRT